MEIQVYKRQIIVTTHSRHLQANKISSLYSTTKIHILFCKIWDQEKQSPRWLINGLESLNKTTTDTFAVAGTLLEIPSKSDILLYIYIYIYICTHTHTHKIGGNAGVVRSVTFDSCIEKIRPDSPLTSVRTDGNSIAASIYWPFLLLEASRGFIRFLRVTIKTAPSTKFLLICKTHTECIIRQCFHDRWVRCGWNFESGGQDCGHLTFNTTLLFA